MTEKLLTFLCRIPGDGSFIILTMWFPYTCECIVMFLTPFTHPLDPLAPHAVIL